MKALLVLIVLSGIACKKAPEPMALQAATAALGKTIVLDAPGEDGDTGLWPHVVFDHQDRAHVAFCDSHHGDVRYAHEVQQDGKVVWDVQSVVSQGAVGKYLAMNVDSQNRVGILFYDQDKMYLRYAMQSVAGGPFSHEPVAWGREAGTGGELVFDAHDVPHIFYYLTPSGKFVHGMRKNGEWVKDAVSAVGVYSVRISARANADGVDVSYVDWKMRDATLNVGHVAADGTFTSRVVSQVGGPGWHSQLVKWDGTWAVVHSQNLTKQTGITWLHDGPKENTYRELVAHGSSFAAETWGKTLLVAFQDVTDFKNGGVLRYTRQAQGAWPVYRIDDAAPVGGHVAMAISQGGRLLIAYYADAEKSLKLYDETLTAAP